MANDNKQFVVDIAKFVSKSNVSVNTFRTFLAYSLFERVIDRTPVYFSYEPTSGQTKYNWRCTLNTLPSGILKGTDKKGTSTKAKMLSVLERVTGDDTIYFSNSMPHIFFLEDGLYPNNPVHGSWNKQTQKYEIRSSGGYSRQAPAGMVKLTMTEVPTLRTQALRKAKALDA